MARRIEIKANPHPGQKAVYKSSARFKILAAGRRWGKTRLGVNVCLEAASQGKRAWWVSPSYKTSEVGWRPLRRIASKVGAKVRLADKTIELGQGSISVRSADNPDSLRGEGLDLVVIDECAFIKEDAWTEALRPALADRLGKAIFITTPKGRNWFWRLWQLGSTGQNPDYQSWQFTSYDNPYIKASEIDAAKTTLPEMVFRQEFMAEFIEDSGAVFRRIMEASTSETQEVAVPGHSYIIGCDWGKHNDFTCLSVIDTTTKQQVYIDRFNQIDYRVQIGRLAAVCDRFNPVAIVAESNAMGEPIIEELYARGLPVQPFQTTNSSKARIIESLALAFEQSTLSILADPVQLSELQAYEMDRLPSGLMRYNAPAGLHDDTVMALAMAWHGASQEVEIVSLADLW